MQTNALICINNPMDRDLIKLVMKQADIPFELANSPHDLVDLVAQIKPILLILDILLPGINGLDAVAKIKSQMQHRSPVVAVISSLAFPEIVSKAQKVGVDEFITKPLDADQLRSRLNRMLNKALSAGVKKT